MEVEKKHGRTFQRTLSEKDLERMGFNFPKDVLRVINEIEVGRDEIDIVKLDRAIPNFVIGFDRGMEKDKEVTSICISNHCDDSGLLGCIPYWWRFDHLLFIDRKWAPTADRSLQNAVIEAIRTGGSVEEVLKCLNDYTYKQSSGGSDDPGKTDSPNAKKEEPTPESHNAEGEQIRISTEGSSDEIEVNTTAACDDRLKAEKEEEGVDDSDLTVEELRRMGFHYPELAFEVIYRVCNTDKSIKGLKVDNPQTGERSCVNSYDMEESEVYRWQILRVYLSEPDFPFSFVDTGKSAGDYKADCLCFINQKFIPTADEGVQFDIVWGAEMTGMSLNESLEFHLKEGEDRTMEETDLQNAFNFCKDIFEKKLGLYGASFCFMHPETVTDQLYMKATILKKRVTDRDKSKRLGLAFFEGMRDEFAAVVNYGIIALRQGGFGVQSLGVPESPMRFYSDQMQAALSLISEKGKEYGSLWRKQRIGTFADMIDIKVRRLKCIENQYRVGRLTKEDYHKFAGDQYRDLINYGLFGVVRMTEIADVMTFEMEEDETEEEGYE